MPLTLETRDLTIRFGGHVAVNKVSCTFHPGELTAIVGPNGAGKTTYFNLISGQLRPTGGDVFLGGEDITRLTAPMRTRKGLGRAFQLTNLFPNLSVEENVRLAVQAASGVHYEMLRPWMKRRDLIERADAILDSIALGNRRAVAGAGKPVRQAPVLQRVWRWTTPRERPTSCRPMAAPTRAWRSPAANWSRRARLKR